MSAEFALWMFPALMVMIFMGFPVAFSLLSVAFVFGALRFNFSPFAANVFAQKVDQVAAAYVLGAVPLFIFMGSLMERSGSRSGCSRRSTCGRAGCPAGWPWARSSCA